MDSSEDEARDRQASGGAPEGTLSSVTETEPRRVHLEERRGAVVLLSGGLDQRPSAASD